MLPAAARLPDLDTYVNEEPYFVIHAARQTGKTTAIIAFAAHLREAGKAAVYVSLESSRGVPDVAAAEAIWLQRIRAAANAQLPLALRPSAEAPPVAAGAALGALLADWARAIGPVPVVLLLDEADVLAPAPLISLLSQLRDGFASRGPGRFPTSVALVGMRDLKDYLALAKGGAAANPGSPCNVKKASLTLRNFTQDEVGELYAQHTADTGQQFTPEAVERAFYWTQGQPFLVNALAYQCVGYARQVGDPRIESTVTADHMDQAKETLILSRTTHLDSLSYRLSEPRVSRVIQAIFLGDERINYRGDDFQYVLDLGLVRRGAQGPEIANPIYREVLTRELTYNEQMNLPEPQWRWRTAEGGLELSALMREFQSWWRRDAEIIEAEATEGYVEAAAHLAFMGFLQRVVNGDGRVTREYGAGRGRIDILVEYAGERHAIELKRVRPNDSLDTIRGDGVTQLSGYLDRLGLTEGWLVIFDQRKGRTWEQRIWSEVVVEGGRTLRLVGG